MAKRGPNTEAGRAAVRLNALKHGLRARVPVILEIEDEKAWEAHRARLVDDLRPEGALEELLVHRIAGIFWRLDRLNVTEVASIMQRLEATAADLALKPKYVLAPGGPATPDELVVEEAYYSRLLPSAAVLDAVIRLGGQYHRHLMQTLHELEALQARRRGEHTPLARLDITAPPNLGPHRANTPPEAAG